MTRRASLAVRLVLLAWIGVLSFAAPAAAQADREPSGVLSAPLLLQHSCLTDGCESAGVGGALVLDLLHKLGYGTNRDDGARVGRSGDGGIDGIISLDKLGLEKVYVQAKRWQSNVGRPDIQGFFGALAGRRATKGVFITTSSYTREAHEFAASVSDKIVLVDGDHLAELMMDHGVGVQHRELRVPRVDSDYFEGE